jgi:hypothetical protein
MKRINQYQLRNRTISDWEVGLQQTIREKWGRGWKAYFVTLQYAPLPGNMKVKGALMNREVDRVAKFLMTRLYRNPKNVRKELRPIWYVFPDFPVHKNEKVSLRDVTINEGLHQHAIVLIPLVGTRTNLLLDGHFQNHQDQYVFDGEDTPLVLVQAVPIIAAEPDLQKVVSYALKAIRKGRAEIDDIYIPTWKYRRNRDPDSPYPGPDGPRQYGTRRAVPNRRRYCA